MPKLREDLLVQLCAVIHDPVTTTDELIPSGETSSYRSNPIGLSEFTLSRREPAYVGRSKAVRDGGVTEEVRQLLARLGGDPERTSVGSCIYANRPGDGSAREQAASCQKVLGGFANICQEYATKRYRSNCINWGMTPFTLPEGVQFPYAPGDWVYIPHLKSQLAQGREEFAAKVVTARGVEDLTLLCRGLTENDRLILQEGCLMNYYAAGYGK